MEIKLYLQLLATLLTLAMIHGKLIVLVFPFHFYQNLVVPLFITLSWRRSQSYTNQSIDLPWFLYDTDSVFGVRKKPMSKGYIIQGLFSRIWTERGEILRISRYSVRMPDNADQINSEYGYFSRSEFTFRFRFTTLFIASAYK